MVGKSGVGTDLDEQILVIQLLELLQQRGAQQQGFRVLLCVKVQGDESSLQALAKECPLLLNRPVDAFLQ